MSEWRVRRQINKIKKKKRVRARLWRVLSIRCGKWHWQKGEHHGSFLLRRTTRQQPNNDVTLCARHCVRDLPNIIALNTKLLPTKPHFDTDAIITFIFQMRKLRLTDIELIYDHRSRGAKALALSWVCLVPDLSSSPPACTMSLTGHAPEGLGEGGGGPNREPTNISA